MLVGIVPFLNFETCSEQRGPANKRSVPVYPFLLSRENRSTRRHVPRASVRRSGGVPARRLKKESRN